eukprot:5427668-Amphidinium_carterae.1
MNGQEKALTNLRRYVIAQVPGVLYHKRRKAINANALFRALGISMNSSILHGSILLSEHHDCR